MLWCMVWYTVPLAKWAGSPWESRTITSLFSRFSTRGTLSMTICFLYMLYEVSIQFISRFTVHFTKHVTGLSYSFRKGLTNRNFGVLCHTLTLLHSLFITKIGVPCLMHNFGLTIFLPYLVKIIKS